MGKRGPKPTPTAILRMRGSWRANLNPGEPQYEPGAPPCPRWLGVEARKVWRRLTPQLAAAGVLTRVDCEALARYCHTLARWRSAVAFLKRRGEIYARKDAQGHRVLGLWPQVALADKLAHQLARLEAEFGLTPASRSRISVSPPARVGGPPSLAEWNAAGGA